MKIKRLFIILILCIFALSICACEQPIPQESDEKTNDVILMNWNVFLGKGDGNAFCATVSDVMPDVMTFQEMRGGYDRFVVPFLRDNPEYILINDRLTEVDSVCSTPIIFNSTKLEVLEFGVELLKDAVQGATYTKSLSYAVFEIISNKKVFVVVGFHGAYLNPSNEIFVGKTEEELNVLREEYHVSNVKQIVSKIDEVKETYGDIPAFFAGDCNFTNQSDAYKLAYDSGYYDAETSALYERNQSGLKSQHTLGKPPVAGLTIDHIFGNAKVEFLTHKIIRNTTSYQASDHDSVVAEAHLL